MKHLNEIESGLAKRIVDRHPRGYIGAIIEGERGAGKSIYAQKIMAKVFYDTEDIDQDQAYKKALDHTLYSIQDFCSLIDYNIRHDIVSPVICLDDATVHFNSYKFFTDQKIVVRLKGVFDTIRSAVTGLLMTCPSRKMLLNFLRQYDDYKIKIIRQRGANDYERIARAYRFLYMPDERKYTVQVPWQDRYNCYLLNKYYLPYEAKRKMYLKKVNDELQAAINAPVKYYKTEKHIPFDVVQKSEGL